MKVLVIGDWHSELHEEAAFHALRKLGHEPVRFGWHKYFKPKGRLALFLLPFYKAQNKYLFGPLVSRLNRDLVALARRERPDVVFLYRGTHIFPDTLRAIRQVAPRPIVVSYNNDDPFSSLQPRWLWRHFLASLSDCDLVLAYRNHNVTDFLDAGAKQVRLLRSWFIPERNHPVALSAEDQAGFGCDVVFIGHYEPDQRVEYLEEVVRQGFSLKLYGHGYAWDPVIEKSPWLKHLRPVRLVWGEEYNKALCGAKVAICFFSKLNRDTYTRRCFEIPATKTLLLAEYSDDLASLYEEGREADYFRSKEELVVKLRSYLKDELRREAVAAAGYQRVFADRHDVVSRMADVVRWVSEVSSREYCASV